MRLNRAIHAVVGVATGIVVLAGCSGTGASTPTPSDTASPTAPTTAVTSVAPSTAAAPSASSTPSASATATVVRPVIKDPCTVFSVAQMNALTKANLAAQKPASYAQSKSCNYTPASYTTAVYATVNLSEGPYTSAFDDLVGQVQSQFPGSTVSNVKVAGAQVAKAVIGTTTGATEVTVFAGRNGVYYQAIMAGTSPPSAYEPLMIKAVETLIAAG